MRRVLGAGVIATTVTVAELMLVGLLNAEQTEVEFERRSELPPIEIERPSIPSKPQRAAAHTKPEFREAPRARKTPAPALDESSMIAGADDAHPSAALGTSLPGLSLPSLKLVGGRARSSEPDIGARALSIPSARYPPQALRKRVEGFVVVRIRVTESGRVRDAVIVEAEPPGVFEEAAMAAVRQYRYSPAKKSGQPVPSTVEQKITFRLE